MARERPRVFPDRSPGRAPGGDIGEVARFRIFLIASFKLKTILNIEELLAVMPRKTWRNRKTLSCHAEPD